MSRVLVYALTKGLAERWCRENDVQPHARTTYILAGPNSGRGFQITPDDRVVLVGQVALARDFQRVMTGLVASFTGPNVIEWHVSGTMLPGE